MCLDATNGQNEEPLDLTLRIYAAEVNEVKLYRADLGTDSSGILRPVVLLR